MAIRIDASGEYTRITTNLPPWASWTSMCWYYHVADRNAWSYIMGIESGLVNAGQYELIGFRSDTTFELSTNAGSNVLADIVPGSWNFMALRRMSGSNDVYAFHMTQAGVWQSTFRYNNSFTPVVLWFGSDSYNEWVNCRLAAMKVWNVGLTDQEIYNEAYTISPRRKANLLLFCPGFPGATERLRDYSGNGRDLTAGGTLTDDDPPPISWGAPYIISYPASSGPVGTEYPQTAEGVLPFTGFTSKSTKAVRAGALSLAGNSSKRSNISRSGVLNFLGQSYRLTNIGRSGAITFGGFAGKLVKISKAGSITFTGLSSKLSGLKPIGSFSFSGLTHKSAQPKEFGSVAFAGNTAKKSTRTMVGAVASSGLILSAQKLIVRIVTGTVTPVGTQARKILKNASGALQVSGNAFKKLYETLVASVSSVGTLGSVKTLLRSVVGALSFTGVQNRRTTKLSIGTLPSAGTTVKRTRTTKSGTTGFSGSVLSAKSFLRTVGQAVVSFVGNLNSSKLVSNLSKFIDGTLNFSGNINMQSRLHLAGATSFIGNTLRSTSKRFTGTITFIGNAQKGTRKKFIGAVGFIGSIKRRTLLLLQRTLLVTGQLRKYIRTSFVSNLTFLGKARLNLRAVTVKLFKGMWRGMRRGR